MATASGRINGENIMSQNPFDFYPGDLASIDGLDGFFSKAWKKIKKVGSSLNKARKKITPKPIRSLGTKIAQNKIVQGVAQGVVSVFGGPIAGAALGAVAAKANADVAKSKYEDAARKESKRQTTAKLKEWGYTDAQIAQYHTNPDTFISKVEKGDIVPGNKPPVPNSPVFNGAKNDAKEIAQSPIFNTVVKDLVNKGVSQQQIESLWRQSNNYKAPVQAEIVKSIYPIIYSDLRKNGVPENFAKTEALQQSEKVAKEKTSNNSALLPLALTALLFLR